MQRAAIAGAETAYVSPISCFEIGPQPADDGGPHLTGEVKSQND